MSDVEQKNDNFLPDVHAPVFTSVNDAQVSSFKSFIDALRADPVDVARAEAERLKPYFSALSERLMKDLHLRVPKGPDVTDASGFGRSFVEAADEQVLNVASPEKLGTLFTAMAKRSRNTILSDLVLLPASMLNAEPATDNATQFAGREKYKGSDFIFGFLQVFSDGKTASTSIPTFAFDDDRMSEIGIHAPEKMLRAFQTLMVAGNHDMQHHFTSSVLNPSISRSSSEKGFAAPQGLRVQGWFNDHFSVYSDADDHSYESWLMLSHARVRELMEDGPEGKALWTAADTFADELKRISGEMKRVGKSPEAIHKTVDYFGTMLGFALMRYMRLDHPLVTHAMERLAEADPLAKETVRAYQTPEYPSEFFTTTLNNYESEGVKLNAPYANAQNSATAIGMAFAKLLNLKQRPYSEMKKLDLIELATSNARLMGAAPIDDKRLYDAHARAGALTRSMVSAAAFDAMYMPFTGTQTIQMPDGATLEITTHQTADPLAQDQYMVQTNAGGSRSESWIKDGKLHRDDGPAYIATSSNGTRKETWYKKGQKYDPRPVNLIYSEEEAAKKGHVNKAIVEDGKVVLYTSTSRGDVFLSPGQTLAWKGQRDALEYAGEEPFEDKRTYVLIYSKEAAERQGTCYAEVEGGKIVAYTALYTEAKMDDYGFKDKEVVWRGLKAEQKFSHKDPAPHGKDFSTFMPFEDEAFSRRFGSELKLPKYDPACMSGRLKDLFRAASGFGKRDYKELEEASRRMYETLKKAEERDRETQRAMYQQERQFEEARLKLEQKLKDRTKPLHPLPTNESPGKG